MNLRNSLLSICLIFLYLRCSFVHAFSCSQITPTLHHATLLNCQVIENNWAPVFNVTFGCNEGFEFSNRETVRSYMTTDGVFEEAISCTAIGCNLIEMPEHTFIERNKIEGLAVLSYHCDNVHSPEICRPETSYVEYACKDGFVLGEGYFFVKCLFSGLWDDMPECVPKEEIEYPIEVTNEQPPEEEETTTVTTTPLPQLTTTYVSSPLTTRKQSVRQNENQSIQPQFTTTTPLTQPNTQTIKITLTTAVQNLTTIPSRNQTSIPPISILTSAVTTPSAITSVSPSNLTTPTSNLSTVFITTPGLNMTTSNLQLTTTDYSNVTNFTTVLTTQDLNMTTITMSNFTTDILTTLDTSTIDITTVFSTQSPDTTTEFITSTPTLSSEYFTSTIFTTDTTGLTTVLESTVLSTLTTQTTTSQVTTAAQITTTQRLTTPTQTTTTTFRPSTIATTITVPTTTTITTPPTTTTTTSTTTTPTTTFTTFQPTTQATPTQTPVPTPPPTQPLTTSTTTSTTYLTTLITQILTTLTTTLPVTTTEPPPPTISTSRVSRNTYNVCFTNYPVPNYFNRSATKFNLITHPSIRGIYMEGSMVVYTCLFGYTALNTTNTITTYCQPNGKWTPVPNCDLHPCWKRVPPRPLNGRREVGLLMNSFSGSTLGSHVNFTCDPYFELVGGQKQIFCNDGKWNESAIPKCQISRRICNQMPPNRTDTARLLYVSGVDVVRELVDNKNDTFKVYTVAGYVCAYTNMKFEDEKRKTALKPNSKDPKSPFIYQNTTCIGSNVWESLPKCVVKIRS